MTGNEALTYLRQRRAFLGESARAARVLGLDFGHLDDEAEALSWAISQIEGKAHGAPERYLVRYNVTERLIRGFPDRQQAERHCAVLNACVAGGRYVVVVVEVEP